MIEAHRGGAGAFPENSRSAFENSFNIGVDSIEFDVVVTADGIPIIHHDAWISPKKCTWSDGRPIPLDERHLISELNWASVRDEYVCGGIQQEEFPNAEVIASPILSLSELLDMAADHPTVTLHYDIKFEPSLGMNAENMARQIIEVIDDHALSNRQYMTSFRSEMLKSLKAYTNLSLTLDWPLFTEHLGEGSSDTLTGLTAEFASTMGFVDYISIAQDADADGIGVPYQIIDHHQASSARQLGLNVQIWTLNSRDLLDLYCDWPVDVIITDIPLEAPCF